MGQSQSGESRSVPIEELSHELAHRFAHRCFAPLELYSFKDVFRTLADSQDGVTYWKEDTLIRFLEIPDSLDVGHVLYHCATYLGAFPFPSLAPCILNYEALLKIVVIMTERYGKVIKTDGKDKIRLLYRSLAIYDKQVGRNEEDERLGAAEKAAAKERNQRLGFDVDEGVEDDDEDDDELALAALEAMDALDAFKFGERINIHHSQIPTDNFRRLIMFLLVIAPLDPLERLSRYPDRVSEGALEGLRRTADNILWAFGIEQHAGVFFHTFDKVVHSSMPYMFNGLGPLFENFLFSKNLDLSKKTSQPAGPEEEPQRDPLLPSEGEILDLNVLSQLSFFIKGSEIFRRLRPLYFGSEAGFSLGSFEAKVLKWMAPTILLVSGTILSAEPSTSRGREFSEQYHSTKYAKGAVGNITSGRVVFGAYLHTPWRSSTKECFGDEKSILFQLEPIHEVFRASTVNTDYIHFSKSAKSGISFGCAPPKSTHVSSASHRAPGPVSLMLDDSLEFGIFTHTAEGGGSFLTSSTRKTDWQTKFEIESLEVWGCGGDEEADRQRQAWAFETREALLRRNINLGKDIEADRALLEMAGLIGNHRSGGSMG